MYVLLYKVLFYHIESKILPCDSLLLACEFEDPNPIFKYFVLNFDDE